jgi:hypothetical protein
MAANIFYLICALGWMISAVKTWHLIGTEDRVTRFCATLACASLGIDMLIKVQP